MFWGFCLVALVVDLGVARGARSDEPPAEIRLVDGKFQPSELTVPADAPFQIKVTNSSDAAIEWESFELHRERVVQPGETIVVRFQAIPSGSYSFFDDFHSDVPHGEIVAK